MAEKKGSSGGKLATGGKSGPLRTKRRGHMRKLLEEKAKRQSSAVAGVGDTISDRGTTTLSAEKLNEPLIRGDAYLLFDGIRTALVLLENAVDHLASGHGLASKAALQGLEDTIGELNSGINALIGGLGPKVEQSMRFGDTSALTGTLPTGLAAEPGDLFPAKADRMVDLLGRSWAESPLSDPIEDLIGVRGILALPYRDDTAKGSQ